VHKELQRCDVKRSDITGFGGLMLMVMDTVTFVGMSVEWSPGLFCFVLM
jgi:hypothetical protein